MAWLYVCLQIHYEYSFDRLFVIKKKHKQNQFYQTLLPTIAVQIAKG